MSGLYWLERLAAACGKQWHFVSLRENSVLDGLVALAVLHGTIVKQSISDCQLYSSKSDVKQISLSVNIYMIKRKPSVRTSNKKNVPDISCHLFAHVSEVRVTRTCVLYIV